MPRIFAFSILILTLVACSSRGPRASADKTEAADQEAVPSTGNQDTTTPEETTSGILAPRRWPGPATQYTLDASQDLEALLEYESLQDACAQYKAGDESRQTLLRCGKWMFFFEHFDTIGVPMPLLQFLESYYRDTFGPSFSNFGLIPNPYGDAWLPLGLSKSSATIGSMETAAFTCASCHFGQMPDGRYSVGYANLQFDYGRFLLGLFSPLFLAINPEDPNYIPQVRAWLEEPVANAKAQSDYWLDFGMMGLQMLGGGDANAMPTLTLEEQDRIWNWPPGTMDFLFKPLADDGVHTVSRIISLWNLPSPQQRQAYGMPHELLSWSAAAESLNAFLDGFVMIGQSAHADAWNEAAYKPLKEYIYSLRTPELLSDLDEAKVEEGAALFVSTGCVGCHAGPSGEGIRVFDFEEVGTDEAMRWIYNPNEEGQPCCDFADLNFTVSFGLKAPRLTGIENQERFLHNGTVESLEALFCMQNRGDSEVDALNSDGHWMTCDLSVSQKRALMAYLRSL